MAKPKYQRPRTVDDVGSRVDVRAEVHPHPPLGVGQVDGLDRRVAGIDALHRPPRYQRRYAEAGVGPSPSPAAPGLLASGVTVLLPSGVGPYRAKRLLVQQEHQAFPAHANARDKGM